MQNHLNQEIDCFLDDHFECLIQDLSQNIPRINKAQLLSALNNRRQVFYIENNQDYFKVYQNQLKLNSTQNHLNEDSIQVGLSSDINTQDKAQLQQQLLDLKPWRKGPFNIFGIEIDAEWRSDYKWQRIKDAIPSLTNKNVLDIGCGNAYYMFRMADQNPKLLLGIDPTVMYLYQFLFINQYLNIKNMIFLPLKFDSFEGFDSFFDVIFCMGVLYHVKEPVGLLAQMKNNMALNGNIVLETMIIKGNDKQALVPSGRYAKMRNVYSIPTVPQLIDWVKDAGFSAYQIVSIDQTTTAEQRVTDWSSQESLADFLDPSDATKTIEGYPAPIRICMVLK